MRSGEIANLFDLVPDVFVFVKDRDSRFIQVNRALWKLHGCKSESEMVGKSDHDFHAPVLAEQYIEEDRRVMEDGKEVVDKLWLVPGADGRPRWYWSSKIALHDDDGNVTGLAGVMRPQDEAGDAPGMLQRLTHAIRYVLTDYGDKVRIAHLAELSGLSVSQFQREFKRLLGISPSEYLTEVRVRAAQHRLTKTRDGLSSIAIECGFCDQSHFVKRFKSVVGMRPLQYRKRFSANKSSYSVS